uniref:Uncharacterized protein n=1 Tax=Clytia hemisphaerica TaxID=252671 RepID=A0A7M5XBU6_9CNID
MVTLISFRNQFSFGLVIFLILIEMTSCFLGGGHGKRNINEFQRISQEKEDSDQYCRVALLKCLPKIVSFLRHNNDNDQQSNTPSQHRRGFPSMNHPRQMKKERREKE